ncbi:hypothetical protein ACN4EE_07965 [Geminocystis sp. CENA526]|uniref:hypothetical protein n=1 Tax=Geminocystis sp. CENA526 TaxID=1355871 RepID=UPI003D6EF9A7
MGKIVKAIRNAELRIKNYLLPITSPHLSQYFFSNTYLLFYDGGDAQCIQPIL